MHPDAGRDDLEAALAALRPAPAPLDRDRLMFQAGQARLAARCRRWRRCSAALLALCVGLAAALCVRLPATDRPERIVYVPVPGAPQAPAAEPEKSAEDPPAGSEQAWPQPDLLTSSYWRFQRSLLIDAPEEPALPDAEDDPPAPVLGVPPAAPLSVWESRNRSY